MEITIKRVEKVLLRREYLLSIDENYIEKFNEWVAKNSDSAPSKITLEDVEKCYAGYSSPMDQKVSHTCTYTTPDGEEKTYIYVNSISDLFYDYINDDVWDNFNEEIEEDVVDVTDYLY